MSHAFPYPALPDILEELGLIRLRRLLSISPPSTALINNHSLWGRVNTGLTSLCFSAERLPDTSKQLCSAIQMFLLK